MDLKDIIAQNKKQYRYTVKLAKDALSTDEKKALEKAYAPLGLVKVEKSFSSPIQENPLDFPNTKNAAVQAFDIVTSYPSATDMLERVTSEAIRVPRGTVVVYTENDPRRAYTKDYLEKKSPDFKKDYVPALGSLPPEAEDAANYYGDEYNKKLIAAHVKERKPTNRVKTPLSPEQNIDKSTHVDKQVKSEPSFGPISGRKTK